MTTRPKTPPLKSTTRWMKTPTKPSGPGKRKSRTLRQAFPQPSTIAVCYPSFFLACDEPSIRPTQHLSRARLLLPQDINLQSKWLSSHRWLAEKSSSPRRLTKDEGIGRTHSLPRDYQEFVRSPPENHPRQKEFLQAINHRVNHAACPSTVWYHAQKYQDLVNG